MNFLSQTTTVTVKTWKQKPCLNVNLPILVWTLALLILLSSVSGSGRSELSCHKLRVVLENRKYLDNKIPLELMNDDHLKKCAKNSGTCCLEETENFFLVESRKEYNSAVRAAINQLSVVLKTRAKRFDIRSGLRREVKYIDWRLYRQILGETLRIDVPRCSKSNEVDHWANPVPLRISELLSEKDDKHWTNNAVKGVLGDFDKMFKKTYGIIYEQNAYVFTDFFEELERYYVKGQVDLEEAMENFFNTLYQKMFTVLNAQYQFDDKYLICIGDHMKELKPFGDVPQKLSVQIKRSFVATRTFAQALNVAKEILDYMKDLGAAGDCHDALLRMSYCQACKGMPEIKPCTDLCLNVLKGCLAYQMDLDAEWNNFVDAMDKVSDRLLGPFNIEVVVEPINIKISEAIMNFQENAHEVSEKVFNGCGRLHLGRRTRRETREIELETYEFAKEDLKPLQSQQMPTLEKLIRDIRQKVKDSKSFWSNLPYQICNDDKVAALSKDTPCWNGTAVGRYTKKVTSNGFYNQQNNPEVNVDTTRPKSILNEQIYNLKIVTNKLKNAYNGFDVDWIDIEESSPADVSSGEGSGNDRIESEGSGVGPSSNSNFGDSNEENYQVEDPGRKIEPNLKRPVSSNDESNVIPKNTDDLLIRGGTTIYSSNGTSDFRSRLSLLKAVVSYVFPICIMWLGSSVYEWL